MATTLFVHLSWTTFRRHPMIGAPTARFLRRFLPAEAQRHHTTVLALGMVSDHVHLLVRVKALFDIPRLMQWLKGASSRLVNSNEKLGSTGLRCARGYDARSVSPGQVAAVASYVSSQKERHPDRAIEYD